MTLYDAILEKVKKLEEAQDSLNRNQLTLKQIRIDTIHSVSNILYSFKDKLENVEAGYEN